MLFEDWWIEDEFLKIIVPADALFGDSYNYRVSMKLKEGVSLPSEMDSSLSELTVTLEVNPDEIEKLITSYNLPCYTQPLAASARGTWTDPS
mmetsp:Transcript_2704/g.4252  ORF Transcript_2704/g.4252 Transcript_2704/m.4252 type:complete len:92 (+) Transcript_2704:2594-2869(+)